MVTQKIIEQIEYYNKRYYDDGVSEISDTEYDALVKSANVEYDYVPGTANTGKNDRVKHLVSTLSLDKRTDLQALEEVTNTFGDTIIRELKYDGITLVHYPDNRVVTRGDGQYGQDVTAAIGHLLPSASLDYPVRGEFILRKDEYERYKAQKLEEDANIEIKNSRNVAAGFANLKDKQAPYGHFVAYEVVGSSESHTEQLNRLYQAGYEFAVSKKLFPDEVAADAASFDADKRDTLDYQIDGLVYRSDISDARKHFGETGHHPKDAIAFKFESPTVQTTLLDVKWQVGRTGRISPVAILEPVEILDTVVERATLHNHAYMETLNIAIGSTVTLTKAHDIIPAIIGCDNTDSLKTYPKITNCPVCCEPLKEVETQAFCVNAFCESRMPLLIAHMASRAALDIEGLSVKTSEKLCEKFHFKYPSDVLRLGVKDFETLEGFAKKSAEKLYAAIQLACSSSPMDRFIYSLGIPNVGKTASELLMKRYKTIENLANTEYEDLLTIDGIGEVIASSIASVEFWESLSNAQNIINVAEYKEDEPKQNTSGLVFCLTGKFTSNKSTYEQQLVTLGHSVESSLKKNVTCLVTADLSSTSSKMETAKKRGLQIMDEQQLNDFLAGEANG